MQALSGYVRRLGADGASAGANPVKVRRSAAHARRRLLVSGCGRRRPGKSAAPQAPQNARRVARRPGREGRPRGKSHLKRANALAGEGDCKAAIEEYTKAYDLLDDPVGAVQPRRMLPAHRRRRKRGRRLPRVPRRGFRARPAHPRRHRGEDPWRSTSPRAGGAQHRPPDAKTPPPLKPARDAGAEGGRDAGSAAARGGIRDQPRYQARTRGCHPDHHPTSRGLRARRRPATLGLDCADGARRRRGRRQLPGVPPARLSRHRARPSENYRF